MTGSAGIVDVDDAAAELDVDGGSDAGVVVSLTVVGAGVVVTAAAVVAVELPPLPPHATSASAAIATNEVRMVKFLDV